MTRGELLAAELPNWEGTPFHPHARAKGAGVDCKGLLWGACAELGFPEAESEYARFISYSLNKSKGIPASHLFEGFKALFDPADGSQPGDILLCNVGKAPGHIAIANGQGRAWNSIPGSGVRLRKTETVFRKFPLHSAWRLR